MAGGYVEDYLIGADQKIRLTSAECIPGRGHNYN